MKHSHAPAVTSLPQAPRDEASARVRNYWITMGIRMACFALTVLVTPYGWYTWVFALGAVFLPYIAVVMANVGKDTRESTAVSPERMLEAPAAPEAAPDVTPPVVPHVIRIDEAPRREPDA